MQHLNLLSGGAAQGLIGAISADFSRRTDHTINGIYGAVGAMRAKLQAGHPTDVVVLTSAIVREMAATGLVVPESVRDVGKVATAIAVRASDPDPQVADAGSLKAALRAADAIYFPDPAQATAGIHFAAVLDKLGVARETASRLRTYPNGATAMKALAEATDVRPIGCTQVTEILATPGVRLVAPLPAGYDLVTQYTAGVVAASNSRDAGLALIELLVSAHDAKTRCGFA
jgi:molybdate transport system substrate-binding protein